SVVYITAQKFSDKEVDMQRSRSESYFLSCFLCLAVNWTGSGCEPAPPSPSDDPQDTRALLQAQLSDLPSSVYLGQDYAVDDRNLYLQIQIGTAYGAFRVPVGAGSPVLFDSTPGYRASFQLADSALYYQKQTSDGHTSKYELWRLAAGATAPTKALDLPFS